MDVKKPNGVWYISYRDSDNKKRYGSVYVHGNDKPDEFVKSKNNKKVGFWDKIKAIFVNKKENVKEKEKTTEKKNTYSQDINKAYALLTNGQCGIDVQFCPDKFLYEPLVNKYYNSIRYCHSNPYEMRPTCSENIIDVISQSNSDIIANERSGWYYRTPRNTIYKDESQTLERLSLNVYPEKELIEKLDKFLIKHNINACYKAPNDKQEWMIRHENIIMYFNEPITQEQKAELVSLISPHTRKTKEDVMIGTKLADGIYQIEEPTEKDVQMLLEKAKKLDFANGTAYNFLKSPQGNLFDRYGNVRTSPACVKAIEMMLNEFEKIKNA